MSRSSTFGPSVFLAEAASGPGGVWRRAPVFAAGLLWLAAGLCAGYWVLLAWGRSPVTPVAPVASADPAPDVAAIARVLGALPESAPAPALAAAASPPAAARYALIGVLAGTQAGGAALIAIDGQPPRPYRVGAMLDGGMVLQSVGRRSVRLAPAAGSAGQPVELSLPPTPASPS